MSGSLWLHRLQHSRLPSPSLSPGVCSIYVHWVDDAIHPLINWINFINLRKDVTLIYFFFLLSLCGNYVNILTHHKTACFQKCIPSLLKIRVWYSVHGTEVAHSRGWSAWDKGLSEYTQSSSEGTRSSGRHTALGNGTDSHSVWRPTTTKNDKLKFPAFVNLRSKI